MPEGVGPATLPSKWDWREQGKVTSVKNQGACGSCYAFASIGNFESKMLIDGASTHDFSENNAKECNWRELYNYQTPAGRPKGSCDGGSYMMLVSLFSQKGVVLESCDPYVPADVECNDACPYQKTLLDWRIISGNTVPNTDVLKSYIETYGPVFTGVYVDSSQGFNDSYDGSYTFNYWIPPKDYVNHCVLIVGWSNDLPPVPGDTEPADGWIVKNSWGPSWGDNGYFYITYGSANIGMSSSFMYDWQDYDNNGDIMYYDDDGRSAARGYGDTTAWGLVKFFPSSDTNITRVEFWTNDKTTDVDVYMYDDFDGTTLSNPLWSSPDHSFAEAGYHGVTVDPPLAVTSGHDIIAVVKFTNDSYGYPIAADKNGPIETRRTYISPTGANGTWKDLAEAGRDVAIRLPTSAAPPAFRVYLPIILKAWPPVVPTPTPTMTLTPSPTVVTLSSIADSCILQGYPGENVGSTIDMWAGYDDYLDPDGKIVRSLVRFDLSGLPPGAQINSATLRLHLTGSWDYPNRYRTITTYRVGSGWAEMAVTWHNKPSCQEAYGSNSVKEDAWGWYDFNVTALVQAWVSGSQPNYGIMVRGPEHSGHDSSWRAFSTKEGAYPPQLVINYTGSAGSAAPRGTATSVVPSESILNVMRAAGHDGRVPWLDAGRRLATFAH